MLYTATHTAVTVIIIRRFIIRNHQTMRFVAGKKPENKGLHWIGLVSSPCSRMGGTTMNIKEVRLKQGDSLHSLRAALIQLRQS
jgi:hypothetical protein